MKATKRQFTQLTIEDREAIQELLRQGCSLREIGRQLHRPHSTISRELMTQSTVVTERYTPRLAQERTVVMRRQRGLRPRLKNQEIRDYVERKLREDWSPEQIAGRIKPEIGQTIFPRSNLPVHLCSLCAPGVGCGS